MPLLGDFPEEFLEFRLSRMAQITYQLDCLKEFLQTLFANSCMFEPKKIIYNMNSTVR